MWGTCDLFCSDSERALGFLEESLELKHFQDWSRQRRAFGKLIQWFFWNGPGPAWISVVPHKPVRRKEQQGCLEARDREVRRGGNIEWRGNPDASGCIKTGTANFGAQFSPLPLNDFLFAYGVDDKIGKDVGLYREQSERLFVSGNEEISKGYDVVYLLANPDDEETIANIGGVTVMRHYCNQTTGLYLCPHIHLCRVPSIPGQLGQCLQFVTRLVVALRFDGRICQFIKSRRTMSAYLRQQEIDSEMLLDVEVLNG
jgi:hypothetical protein